jgi:tRNA pseudouridine38-40 synthase
LEKAFYDMTGKKVRIAGASRTDSGVHAREQVACLENFSRHSPEILQKGLNALLPEDIAVLSADWAPAGFDPRRQALGKHYRYCIHTGRVKPVFERNFFWHIKRLLDVFSMQQAGPCLVGRHDFSAFRAAGCEARDPVRVIDSLHWRLSGQMLVLDVFGRSFLKQMVRNIVGTFLEIGSGRFLVESMLEILLGCDRARAGRTAAAQGLCLMRVFFDEQEYRWAFEKRKTP